MHPDYFLHQLSVREFNVVEYTTPQESIGKLFLSIARDDCYRPVDGFNGLISLRNIEAHFIQFIEKVIGKLNVSLIYLVDEKHYLFRRSEGLSQFAQLYILLDVGNILSPKRLSLSLCTVS